MRTEQLAGLILAGGQSRRMGQSKASLTFGGKTFLELAQEHLSLFQPVYLSVSQAGQYPVGNAVELPDRFPGMGALGAIATALQTAEQDGVFVLACDYPLFRPRLAEYLCRLACEGVDAVIAQGQDGQLHPLCGVYLKSALPVISAMLESGNLRMMELLRRLRTIIVPLEDTVFPPELLRNINTPQEYRALSGSIPAVVAVSGIKHSGKTTFLCRLLPELAKYSLKVGVIKHDGHDFEPDVPGTDSYKLRQAGAAQVAVYSSGHTLLARNIGTDSETELFPAFRGFDLLLLEGFKYSDYPKIEIVRQERSSAPVGKPETLLGVATDTGWTHPDIPTFPLEDVQTAAQLILRYMEEKHS